MAVESRQEYLKINKKKIPVKKILSKGFRTHKEEQALVNWYHTQEKIENTAHNKAIFSGFLRENGKTIYVAGEDSPPSSWYSQEDGIKQEPNLDDIFTGDNLQDMQILKNIISLRKVEIPSQTSAYYTNDQGSLERVREELREEISRE